GTSSSGQFMFQSYLGKLDEVSAAIVFPVSQEQQIFRASKSWYAAESWSRWVEPDLVSADRDIMFKILYDRNLPKTSGGPVKAMARFKIGSYVQWREQTDGIGRDNLQSNLEPCPLTPNTSLQSGPAASGRPPELQR